MACDARSRRWPRSTTRAWSAGCARSSTASGPTSCWSTSTGHGSPAWSAATARSRPQQYLPLAIDLASALHYFRHLGQVHLDVKPSNIIMGSPARLIDLSVMRSVEEQRRLDHVIGTDAYLSPEQADPGRLGAPGPPSDVWGLGATLFHAIAGDRPYAEGDPTATEVALRHPQVVADVPAAAGAAARRGRQGGRGVPRCRTRPTARSPTRSRTSSNRCSERLPRARLTGFGVRR